MEAGLDSLGATELASQLSSEFGVKLAPTFLFSYPCMNDIIGYLSQTLGVSVDKSGSEAEAKAVEGYVGGGGGVSRELGDVAIVGVGCRFPGGVRDLDSMWRMMCSKADHTSEVSIDRWDTDALIASRDDIDASVLDRIRYGGFLSESVLNDFDGSMFGISDAEAERMDPSQRLLLQVSYDALEDAKLTMDKLRGTDVGVFVGISGTLNSEEQYGLTVASRNQYMFLQGLLSR
jgi:hypothetical protein